MQKIADPLSRPMRRFITLAAVLGWSALLIQISLILISRWEKQASLLGGLVYFLSFFTILTNVLVALTLTRELIADRSKRLACLLRPQVSSAIAASILFVGLSYSLLLRHLWQPQGWQWLADVLLHDVMPVLFVLYWWLRVPKGRLRAWHILPWMAYPLFYFGYLLLRGVVAGLYPYPFIDIQVLGYGKALLNASMMLISFSLISLLIVGADHWRAKQLIRRRGSTA